MGSLIGHVLPGIAFLALGLWHLFNHIKLYSLQPNSYISSPWFPTSKIRYLELLLIIAGSSISISMELFIGPQKHQPFDTDGTIPSNHLRNFEHSSISMFFIVYASFAILLDRIKPISQIDLTQLIGAIAFSQQYLLFYLHSTDHKGLEGQYHFLLQIIVIVSIVTTLMGIGLPKSFLISFVRSVSIIFQGVWFVVMGYMLWTPQFIPKGCLIHNDDGHIVVKCGSQEALHRAKSLVNILFSWFLIGLTIFSISFYLVLVEKNSKRVQYSSLPKEFEELQEDSNDVESQKEKKFGDSKGNFTHVGSGFPAFDLERFKL
ncbi:hypothetical protein JCGZ_19207 [Jatropha curcas]|uniref:Transmembrane protein 45A-like n=1 Tax=Jatropha curcas TaxID=180498 RepID=A0A067LIB7_JATCU|nr:transmembrane protein 45B [Jatropha curcas]KDP44340.1 hypothetical protein JCGZ_19207 [Jatropha curcas]